MSMLIYSAISSLDGFIEDATGKFDWAAPDEELHTFINDRERPIGTYLYGRRMYETMVGWETMQLGADSSAAGRDFAQIWRSAEKVVFSRTLAEVSSARTRIERTFDPEEISRLKRESDHDITVGGPELAGQAFAAGLVDECHLFLHPVIVGGGKPSLPRDVRVQLELLDERRFVSGVVHLHHRFVA